MNFFKLFEKKNNNKRNWKKSIENIRVHKCVDQNKIIHKYIVFVEASNTK